MQTNLTLVTDADLYVYLKRAKERDRERDGERERERERESEREGEKEREYLKRRVQCLSFTLSRATESSSILSPLSSSAGVQWPPCENLSPLSI
jgi:hypothetical protein